MGFLFVAHVDHSQSCSGVESIPVCGKSCPADVVSEEGVVGGVGIHDAVGPDAGPMGDRVALTDFLLDSAENEHVSVVVFLQELLVVSVPYFSRQDLFQLFHSPFL